MIKALILILRLLRKFKELGIEHRVSSPYHPESQRTLERFHQTLKTMIHVYCLQTGKDWVEGLPLLLIAARE